MSGTTLSRIEEMWHDEGFPMPAQIGEPAGGQRVTLFQRYVDQVDWEDPPQARRALAVFQEALKPLFAPDSHLIPDRHERVIRLQRLFLRDGYTLADDGAISVSRTQLLDDERLSNLTDAQAIRTHLDRIENARTFQDAEQLIGSAKELIESTAKLVLQETGLGFRDSDDLPKLTSNAEDALHVSPRNAAPGPDGSQTVRKTLGAAHTIAQSVAELRNDYGTGHGRATRLSGLSARHATLAVNAAKLWCEFMLDTLGDPKAPWRRNAAEE